MTRKSNRSAGVSVGLDRLAGLFENGALDAATRPAAFLGNVCDEIERMRGALKRIRRICASPMNAMDISNVVDATQVDEAAEEGLEGPAKETP